MPDEQPVFILISCDPRSTGRAFEAMRIAVGIVAGENDVTIVLVGPAVHLLDEDTDDLVDGDDIAKFRSALKKLGIVFHVETGAAPPDPDWNADGHPVAPIDADGVAALAARASRYLVF